MTENDDFKKARKNNEKKSRKPLPKVKELKNTQGDIVGGIGSGAAAAKFTGPVSICIC